MGRRWKKSTPPPELGPELNKQNADKKCINFKPNGDLSMLFMFSDAKMKNGGFDPNVKTRFFYCKLNVTRFSSICSVM